MSHGAKEIRVGCVCGEVAELFLSNGAKMLSVVLLVVWCTFGADADGGIYHVDRQDFSSPSPVVRSLSYQHLVNGRPGVYQVSRQDFAGNAPFSQNAAPSFDNMHGYYPHHRVSYSYTRNGNNYPLQYGPAPTIYPPPSPRLFVPAQSGYPDESGVGQPNYKDVLSLSEYNRRFDSTSSYLQPTMPPYFQPPAQSQTSVPPYFQRPAQSQTAVPSYFLPPFQSQTAVPTYSQSPVTRYWMTGGTFPTTWLPPTTAPPTTIPPTTVFTNLPLPQAPATNEDDGILSPIPANDEENKPLPPVSAQNPLGKVLVTEDAAGNRHTKVKYHSFNDFVEISDEHRELLESFGSIQNNESDFSELPEASPIRRRRNATHSQVFSMFTVQDSQLRGASIVPRDPEQLLGSYINRLWGQIQILNDMKKAVQGAKNQQQSAKSSPKTIVASDDSTVIVFNGNANFDGQLGGQVGQQESTEDLTQSSLHSAESSVENKVNPSEDSLPSSKEINPSTERSTEPKSAEATTTEADSSDGSHEVLLQRDEGADSHPTSDPRDQIIYLTEEPFEVSTYSQKDFWE